LTAATTSELPGEIRAAAGVLAAQGLVNAFGHVSAREAGRSSFLIVRPPLGFVGDETPLIRFSLEDGELPAGAPGEAWIHWAIYRSRPDVGAVCRAQPAGVAAAAAAGLTISPLHGHGAFLGPAVPTFDDARLIRSRESGEELATLLGRERAVVMRGNGAVTVGSGVAAAVARMWALEASARLNLAASSAGKPQPLTDEEQRYWQGVEEELLERIWLYLEQETERAQPRPR
jgi:HCOMODA/2-hydroxy-3-carboxy-muconic semialdehyde decarboxylase